MKRSTSDIVFIIFEIIIFATITLWLAFSIALMIDIGAGAPDDSFETVVMTFAVLVYVFLGLGIHIGTFLFSFVFLLTALYFKKVFVKKADKTSEGYEKCLKIKKRNVMHFSLLMAYAVVSGLVIYIVGSIL